MRFRQSQKAAEVSWQSETVLQRELLPLGDGYRLTEAPDFRAQHASAEIGELVIAAALAVRSRLVAALGLAHQLRPQHPIERSIQGAGAHLKPARGFRLDRLHDGVAMLLAVGE